MKKSILVMFLLFTLFSCKDEKKSLAGDEKVVTSDFFNAFSKLKLPFTITDTSINNIKTDTASISNQVFSQFVPDSVINNEFKNEKNPVIRSVGKHEAKGKETYVVMQVRSKKQTVIYLLVFDKKQKFSTSLPLLKTNTEPDVHYTATIDNRLAISITKDWKTEEEFLYNRVIYAYNSPGSFNIVMTETNDQSKLTANYLNPFDTLPKLNKYSGDYKKGKKSIVSIRDGKTPESYVFFMHFENDDQDEPCSGELRGDFVMRSATSAIFSENSDPCVIDFTFTNTQVKVKEQGACGSHRGIKCFFNDTYTKKKEPKATKKT
jgi:hypothetical protein